MNLEILVSTEDWAGHLKSLVLIHEWLLDSVICIMKLLSASHL